MHGSVVMPSMPLRDKNISTHFEHRGRFNEHRAIILTGARQSLHAPERAETEGSFLPADSVISLANIIAIYEVLQANGINTTVSSAYINEGTLVVKPPRSGDFKICFNVFTNLSSVCKTIQHTALSENIIESRDTTHRRAKKYQWHNQHR